MSYRPPPFFYERDSRIFSTAMFPYLENSNLVQWEVVPLQSEEVNDESEDEKKDAKKIDQQSREEERN